MLPNALQSLSDQIDAIEADARAVVAGLTDDQINRQPGNGSGWSIGQCLGHLVAMNDVYLTPFHDAMLQARSQDAGSYRGMPLGVVARWFVRITEPPPKVRTKAPKAAQPASNYRRDDVLAAFVAGHARYRHLLQRSAQVDPMAVTAPNPFFKLIRMRVATVLHILPAHDRRHLFQAHRVREQL